MIYVQKSSLCQLYFVLASVAQLQRAMHLRKTISKASCYRRRYARILSKQKEYFILCKEAKRRQS